MLWLLLVTAFFPVQARDARYLDVTTLQLAPPAVVAELDLGKLKGEFRQLAWAPDGESLYLQTMEEAGQKVHHYKVGVATREVTVLEEQPDWALKYWTVKQDRVAPGNPSLVIDVKQGLENMRRGTGNAGALDRSSNPSDAVGQMSADGLASAALGSDKAHVVRLELLGETIGVWVNESRVIPGTKFSWGPEGSGSLVYVAENGRLVLLDQRKNRRVIPDVSDAALPAWSLDGARLAFLKKTGRKKFALMWLAIAR